MKKRTTWGIKTALGIAAILSLIAVNAVNAPSSAQAANAADFSPGYIISDAAFYSARMSQDQIQALLASNGSYLASFSMPTVTKPAGSYSDGGNSTGWGVCSQYDGVPGGESAAAIIYKVQNACGVSAQALLVTLQKESSLVTSGTSSWLRSAMGYGCPDTADCDANYYWFFNQMFGAARSFQWYGNQAPGGYSSKKYAVGYWNIQYKPGTSCGTQQVYVENRATAALYYYTPYVPNAAALANLYGSGDGCSSYGNRNFWRIYTDWFGPTRLMPGSVQFVKAAYNDVLGRAPESDAVVTNWATAVTAGMSRAAMANAFNNSDEYRIKKIYEAYNKALHRNPEPAGLDYWLGGLRRGRLSPEDLYSTFLYSDEMFNVQGGGTFTGYTTALYVQLLGRNPEPTGLDYWVARLNAGEPRNIISDGIWYSNEKYNARVNEAYVTLLGRTASAADQAYWSSVARTLGTSGMRSQIMSSDEYWNRAISRF